LTLLAPFTKAGMREISLELIHMYPCGINSDSVQEMNSKTFQ